MRLSGRLAASQTAEAFGTGYSPAGRAVVRLWVEGRQRQDGEHPFELVWCRKDAKASPAWFFLAPIHRRRESFADGLTHARNRQKMKGLLDGIPIFFANEYAIGAWAGDEHRLVGDRRFIEQPVQLLPGLAGIHRIHVCQRTLFRTFRQATAP